MQSQSLSPDPIPAASSFEDVIDAIGSVVDWSLAASSRLGYFAALYKQITVAVRTAVAQGAFEDGPRMERLDVTFANRYFDALNGYFHARRYPKPTRSWQAVFDAAYTRQPILVQHLVAGVTAHIHLDLGIVTAQLAGWPTIAALHNDFDTINAVLAGQVGAVVARVDQLSPELSELYALLPRSEIFLINTAVRTMRDSAWRFASLLTLELSCARGPTIWMRDRWVAGQVEAVIEAAELTAVSDSVLDEIAEHESRDIARNIRVLADTAASPGPIKTTL